MNDSEQHSRPEVTVFLPCHSLEDLSEWMENDEASAILNAWTVAWHPFVICESEGFRVGQVLTCRGLVKEK